MDKKHIGSALDDFLDDENILAETEARALKAVFSWEIEKALDKNNLTKTQMARRMRTSRSAFDRLLDPKNTSVTLMSLEKAALSVGKKIHIELKDMNAIS